jgi:hypothetical protein
VEWNGSIWVAGGQGTINTLAWSYDGITWTGLGKSIFSSNVRGIAWNGPRWVAVGDGTANTIAYSTDGISWTVISTSTSIFSSGGNDVSWDGKRWIAVGNGLNRVATSNDGITWYGVATSTSLFTGSGGFGVSTNYNASSNQLVVSNTSGTTLSNRLEIVADSYYNQGPTKLSLSITSNNL